MATPQASEKLPSPIVCGTGFVALDIVLSADPSLPPLFAAGGTCGNVLSNLGYFGWDVYPIARLSDDPASAIVRRDLTRSGVSLRFVEQQPAAPTPIIVQTIRRDSRGHSTHEFSTSCPVCGVLFPTFRPVTLVAAESVLGAITGSVQLIPQVFYFDRASRGSILLAHGLADYGTLVVFEPAGVDEPRLFDEAVAAAHILKYSNERLPRLADSTPRPEHLLLEIETCGLAGLRYRLPAREHWDWRHLKAIPAPYVADTAGAGDWCTSGFLFQVASVGRAGLERASPADLEGGLRFGQAAAAVACGYEGARGAALAHSCADFLTLVQKLACGDSLGTLGEGIQRFAHARAVPHTASECPICTT